MMAPDSPTVMTALQSKDFTVLAQLLAEIKEVSSDLLRQIKTYEKKLFDAIILASSDIMHVRGHNLLQATQSSSALHQVFQNSTHFTILKARHDLFYSRTQDFALSDDIKEFPNFPRGFCSEAQLRRNEQFIDILKKHSSLLSRCLNENRSKAFFNYIKSIQPRPFRADAKDISNFMPEQVLAYTGQNEYLSLAFEQLLDRKTARSGADYLSTSRNKLDELDEFVTRWHWEFLHRSMGLMAYGDDIKAIANFFNTRKLTVDCIFEYDGWHKYYFMTHWAVHCRQVNFFKDVNQRRQIHLQIQSTYKSMASLVMELDVLYQQYLFIAVRLNYPEFVEIILNAAREDSVSQARLSEAIIMALGYAVLYRRFEIFKLLLNSGLQTKASKDLILFSILSLKIGHIEFLNLALEKLYPQGLGQVKTFYDVQINEFFADSGSGSSLIEYACEQGQHVLTILCLLESGAYLRTPDRTNSKSRRQKILELTKYNRALNCLIAPQVQIIELIDKICSFAINPTSPYLMSFGRTMKLSSEEKAVQDSLLSKIPTWEKWSQTAFYNRRDIVLEIIKEIENGLKLFKDRETIFTKKLADFNNMLQQLVDEMPASREDALNKLQEQLRLQNEKLMSSQKSVSQKTTSNAQTWSVANTYRWFANFLDNLDGVSSGMITASGPSLEAPAAAAVVKEPPVSNNANNVREGKVTVSDDHQKPVVQSLPPLDPESSVGEDEKAAAKNPRQMLSG